MNSKSKILIISYYWPPGSSPGVQRWLKFAKYLPQFGISTSVLTVKNGSFPSYDESLNEEVEDSVDVHRAKSFEPFALYNLMRGKRGKQVEVGMGNIKSKSGLFSRISNYVRANLFVPDARVGWNFLAFKKAKRIIETQQIDLIITTGPPHSTHLIGLRLKSAYPKLKWIADLRDPWTNIYYNQFLKRTARAQKRDQRLEDSVLSSADRVTVVSPGMRDEFKDRAQEVQVVFNGFDEEDIVETPIEKTSYFTLAYIGNFKASQDIPAFWSALNRFISSIPEDSFRLKLVGNRSEVIDRKIKEHLDPKAVIEKPFLPHDEAILEMHHSSLLYLPIPQLGNNRSIITGKIFEYLAVRRPILSVGPIDGDAALILKSAERDAMIAYEDEELIYERLMNEYKRWSEQKKIPFEHQGEGHMNYTRKGMAKRVSEIIKELLYEA